MSRCIRFIAGIHGSGKTTYCQNEKSATEPHYSCSAIIKKCKNLNPDRKKIAKDVANNQPSLIDYINEEIHADKIILDGHFCLFTKDYQIHEIDVDVFRDMKISSITIITAKPSLIFERLLKRDGISHPVEQLERLQEKENERALFIAEKLGVPLTRIDTTNKIN